MPRNTAAYADQETARISAVCCAVIARARLTHSGHRPTGPKQSGLPQSQTEPAARDCFASSGKGRPDFARNDAAPNLRYIRGE
jgi:hypothetical protein